MYKHYRLSWLAGFVFLCLFLAACSARHTNIVPTTNGNVQTVLPIPSKVIPPIPTHTLKPTISSTPTLIVPVEPTPTLIKEIVWNVSVSELPDWPVDAFEVIWEKKDVLQVNSNYEDEKTTSYDLQSDPISILPSVIYPTATPFHQQGQQHIQYSPNENYVILCNDKEEKPNGDITYHTLQLFQVRNNQLISQVNNVSVYCSDCCENSRFSWAKDETVFSFASVRTSRAEDPYPIDVYVWKTDGSKPFIIGDGISDFDAGAWSPDNQRLVVELDFAYKIYYLDGTPPKEVFADTTTRGFSELRWVNNEILTERSDCCVTCSFESFYLADTGEEINELYWSNCYHTSPIDKQWLEYSPDNRWVVVDQTAWNDPFAQDLKTEFSYTLFDLNSKQAFSLSKSEEVLLDFVGWGDNSTFYLIRRPINQSIQPKPDEPFGLLALDAPTQQMRLINPDLWFAWLSPNQQFFLAASRSDAVISTAIYTIDGKAVGEHVNLEMPEPIIGSYVPELDSWDIPTKNGPIWFIWSDDGNKVAYRDINGTLWLADVYGRVQNLARNLTPPRSLSVYRTKNIEQVGSAGLVWSLDCDYLLVRSENKAWIFVDK